MDLSLLVGKYVLVYQHGRLIHAFPLHHNHAEGFYVTMCGKRWNVKPYPQGGTDSCVETCGLVQTRITA